MKLQRTTAIALIRLIGITFASVGVGFYTWPAGMVVFGLGLYIDTMIGES